MLKLQVMILCEGNFVSLKTEKLEMKLTRRKRLELISLNEEASLIKKRRFIETTEGDIMKE